MAGTGGDVQLAAILGHQSSTHVPAVRREKSDDGAVLPRMRADAGCARAGSDEALFPRQGSRRCWPVAGRLQRSCTRLRPRCDSRLLPATRYAVRYRAPPPHVAARFRRVRGVGRSAEDLRRAPAHASTQPCHRARCRIDDRGVVRAPRPRASGHAHRRSDDRAWASCRHLRTAGRSRRAHRRPAR